MPGPHLNIVNITVREVENKQKIGENSLHSLKFNAFRSILQPRVDGDR
jgi:hypothetical protein